MILTIAFLGLLALTFLLIHWALAVCQGRSSPIHKQQREPIRVESRNMGPERVGIPPSDTLEPAQRG